MLRVASGNLRNFQKRHQGFCYEKNDITNKHDSSHAIAWAVLVYPFYQAFSGPPLADTGIQCHASALYNTHIWHLDGIKQVWLNMEIQNIPIKAIDNKVQLDLDLNVYSVETIDAAAYKFTGLCYVLKSLDSEKKDLIHLVFEAKDGCHIDELTAKQFCNELLDQQVRYQVSKQFGHIRDLIVEEAFKPINS